ncbi:hypothetical protein [Acaryochloris marina]|uniref:hypothetical protein n=1 Tax=Acaryochloris marina TaxID=155978 RepID=UPI0021C44D30|nr:hypothetical protein [Acaryochloris marina]BDM83873.1 hypothetical protein AM10699_67340 [Acaryochloris marina MBIC10699]
MALLDFEDKSLAELEKIFLEPSETGSDALLSSGLALKTIQDNKLYLPDSKGFKVYVEENLGVTYIHAFRCIQAAELVLFLQEHFDVLPKSESAARPLVKLSRANQLKAWGEVVRITAKDKWAPGKDRIQKTIAALGLDRV